jgi:hypothetical protein
VQGSVKLKALLVCEDVRFEVGGTVTLVGVFNERLLVEPGEGLIALPRLACLAVIGGLRGVEQIGFRQWIRLEDDDPEARELRYEPHHPELDEHNFVFSQSPMVFPDEGNYEIAIDLEIGDRRQGYRYPFRVERRAV